MRCEYCNALIIHRFNGQYTTHDRRAKQKHERMCKKNPENIKRNIQLKHHLARYFKANFGTYDIGKGNVRIRQLTEWRENNE